MSEQVKVKRFAVIDSDEPAGVLPDIERVLEVVRIACQENEPGHEIVVQIIELTDDEYDALPEV